MRRRSSTAFAGIVKAATAAEKEAVNGAAQPPPQAAGRQAAQPAVETAAVVAIEVNGQNTADQV